MLHLAGFDRDSFGEVNMETLYFCRNAFYRFILINFSGDRNVKIQLLFDACANLNRRRHFSPIINVCCRQKRNQTARQYDI